MTTQTLNNLPVTQRENQGTVVGAISIRLSSVNGDGSANLKVKIGVNPEFPLAALGPSSTVARVNPAPQFYIVVESTDSNTHTATIHVTA